LEKDRDQDGYQQQQQLQDEEECMHSRLLADQMWVTEWLVEWIAGGIVIDEVSDKHEW